MNKKIFHKILRILRDRIRDLNIPTNENERKLVSLRRNRKKNRCFLIGNGPSLKAGDLELIAGEDSMACNRIYLIYPETSWRPTYYLAVDPKVVQPIADEIPGCIGPKVLATGQCVSLLAQGKVHAQLRELMHNPKIAEQTRAEELPSALAFSNNVLLGVEAGWATLYNGLQLAFWLGYKEVVLLGVDHSYPKNISGNSKNYVPDAGLQSHFSSSYLKTGAAIDPPNLTYTTAAFARASVAFHQVGRRLLNASRTSALEVVEKESLESVLLRR